MFRKLMIVLLGAAAIAAVTVPTYVSARGWRGGHGWHGSWGYRGGYYGFRSYGYPYAYYPAGYYGCYRTVRVATPYGWGWRRVWVCG